MWLFLKVLAAVVDYGTAIEPGNHGYVNRGVGYSITPARVHAMPELTLLTLLRTQ